MPLLLWRDGYLTTFLNIGEPRCCFKDSLSSNKLFKIPIHWLTKNTLIDAKTFSIFLGLNFSEGMERMLFHRARILATTSKVQTPSLSGNSYCLNTRA